MKKGCAFLAALAVVVCMAVAAFAAETPLAAMTADKTALQAGESVTLTITIDRGLSNLNNFEFFVYFDEAVFEKTGSAIGDAYGAAVVGDRVTDRNGRVGLRVSGLDIYGDPVSLNAGVIAAVTFTAKADITAPVNADFELAFVAAPDYDTFAANPVSTDGNIRVSIAGGSGGDVPIVGDADGNGSVDYFDAMVVMQYFAGLIDETQLDVSAADVDNSGDLDFFDGMYILQYFAGIIDALPVES